MVSRCGSLKFQYHMLVLAIILAPITALICNKIMMRLRYFNELNAYVIYIYIYTRYNALLHHLHESHHLDF